MSTTQAEAAVEAETETEKGKENNAGATKVDSNEKSGNNTNSCTREELTELVRAIKFAKPDASMRAVHREISQELSKKAGFAFLADIPLNDVKKVWKKAVTAANKQSKEANGDKDSVMKLYTVGDASVRLLAQEYSQAAAAAEAAKSQEGKLLLENYVHVFADVPMDRSGSRPHQALINFNDNNNNNNKKNNSNNSSNAEEKNGQDDNNNSTTSDETRGVIVKIQVAASDESDQSTTLYPMLLYNQDRSLKTFIHPDPQDPDDGFQRIRNWIMKEGVAGSLGNSGGAKAYFYARLTKPKKQGASIIISIDMAELAPAQTW